MGTVEVNTVAGRHKHWVDSEEIMDRLGLGNAPRSVANLLRRPPEERRAPSTRELIEGAEKSLSGAKTLRASGNNNWAFGLAYCSMFQVVRALVSNAGLLVPWDDPGPPGADEDR